MTTTTHSPEEKTSGSSTVASGFLNPYAFVSIPDRSDPPATLADGPPAGHDRYHSQLWTGSIDLEITTRTPLLIPDHAVAEAGTNESVPEPPLLARTDHLGRPVLAGSAVKGMLRSAYETITNSRFGVLSRHDQRLAIRGTTDASVAARLRPAIVTAVGDTGVTLKLVERLEPRTRPRGHERAPIQRAVWFPRDLVEKPTRFRPRELRGRRVEAWIHLAQLRKGHKSILLWRVAGYAAPGQLPAAPPPVPAASGSVVPFTGADQVVVRVVGRIHWTGSTFPAGGYKKHDERLVVERVLSGQAKLTTRSIVVDAEGVKGWQAVIDSFAHVRRTETDERQLRRKYAGYVWDSRSWRDLKPHDTLYVELSNDGKTTLGLYPAMIGRKPFPGSPKTAIPHSHRPTEDRGRLSPADRVFGWASQNAEGTASGFSPAHRGHVRVLPPHGEGIPAKSTVRKLGSPLRLVPLNSPKPSQFRFYLGDRDGAPLDGVPKEPGQGYPAEHTEASRRVRGRKVYLTHAETLSGVEGCEEYWDPPRDGRHEIVTVHGKPRYREYQAADDTKDQVSTVVSQWVDVGTVFGVTLHVDNLDATELGALIWLLTLPAGAVLKLGLGKPLGFGAVEIALDRRRPPKLFTGEQLLDRYRTPRLSPEPTDPAVALRLGDEYDRLLREHLPEVRTEFLNAARGFPGLAVHYPRLGDGTRPPEPRATTYDWWVHNDTIGTRPGQVRGLRCGLGSLGDLDGLVLPYRPSERVENSRSDQDRRS